MEPQTAGTRPAAVATGFRTQPLPTTNFASAFAAAEGVVSQHFQIASANPEAGTIVFVPSEYSRLGGARMRRSGQLTLRSQGGQILAAVQVARERYATPAARTMHQQTMADDVPTQTPIQEDAGLTPAQQEYWDPTGRDYELEARILNDIVAALSTTLQPAADDAGEEVEAEPAPAAPAPPADREPTIVPPVTEPEPQ